MEIKKDDIILTKKLSPAIVNAKEDCALRYLGLSDNYDKVVPKNEIAYILESLSLYTENGITILSNKKTFDSLLNLIDSDKYPSPRLLLHKTRETLELEVPECKLYPVEKISKKNHIKIHRTLDAKSWSEIKDKISKLREKIN